MFKEGDFVVYDDGYIKGLIKREAKSLRKHGLESEPSAFLPALEYIFKVKYVDYETSIGFDRDYVSIFTKMMAKLFGVGIVLTLEYPDGHTFREYSTSLEPATDEDIDDFHLDREIYHEYTLCKLDVLQRKGRISPEDAEEILEIHNERRK